MLDVVSEMGMLLTTRKDNSSEEHLSSYCLLNPVAQLLHIPQAPHPGA